MAFRPGFGWDRPSPTEPFDSKLRRGLERLRPACTYQHDDCILEAVVGHRIGIRDSGIAMIRFGFLRDALFVGASGAYALNRWLLAPLVASSFLRGYFNDLLLIPAGLPFILWIQRITGLRQSDAPPTWCEIGTHLVVWSIVCEYIGPFWLHRGTADIWDVFAYSVGAGASGIWWNRRALGTLG